MEYMPGRIFKDVSLPGMSTEERRLIYGAMSDVLAKIHKVDIERAHLTGYGKSGKL